MGGRAQSMMPAAEADWAAVLPGATGAQLRTVLDLYVLAAGTAAVDDILVTIAESARVLVDSGFAAVAVIGRSDDIDHVHTSGVGTRAPITSRTPTGQIPPFRRVLNAGGPVREPQPEPFLGVPITIRGQTVGVLYFTDPAQGAYAEDDERLAAALAGAATIALDGTVALADARHSTQWLTASARITRELLGERTSEPFELVARLVKGLADAEFVAIMLREGERRFRTAVTFGGNGRVYLDERVNPYAVPAGEAILQGRSARYPTFEETVSPDLPNPFGIGPVMLAPMAGSSSIHGVLCVGRAVGRPEFTEAELHLATAFAGQVALALEIAEAQSAAERAQLLEERARITRALNDTVIERLLGVGLGLANLANAVETTTDRDRLTTYVRDLDDTISQIRAAIWDVGHTEYQ